MNLSGSSKLLSEENKLLRQVLTQPFNEIEAVTGEKVCFRIGGVERPESEINTHRFFHRALNGWVRV